MLFITLTPSAERVTRWSLFAFRALLFFVTSKVLLSHRHLKTIAFSCFVFTKTRQISSLDSKMKKLNVVWNVVKNRVHWFENLTKTYILFTMEHIKNQMLKLGICTIYWKNKIRSKVILNLVATLLLIHICLYEVCNVN